MRREGYYFYKIKDNWNQFSIHKKLWNSITFTLFVQKPQNKIHPPLLVKSFWAVPRTSTKAFQFVRSLCIKQNKQPNLRYRSWSLKISKKRKENFIYKWMTRNAILSIKCYLPFKKNTWGLLWKKIRKNTWGCDFFEHYMIKLLIFKAMKISVSKINLRFSYTEQDVHLKQ